MQLLVEERRAHHLTKAHVQALREELLQCREERDDAVESLQKERDELPWTMLVQRRRWGEIHRAALRVGKGKGGGR